jgi:2-amino-4-hydroxy-6-hydroxymethyldihydropteridine diphosphokinase
MNKEKIFVALGTNIGNKQENLQKALLLMDEKGIKVVKSSSWYITEPYGFIDQDVFLNGVVEVAFPGEARQLLELLLT